MINLVECYLAGSRASRRLTGCVLRQKWAHVLLVHTQHPRLAAATPGWNEHTRMCYGAS